MFNERTKRAFIQGLQLKYDNNHNGVSNNSLTITKGKIFFDNFYDIDEIQYHWRTDKPYIQLTDYNIKLPYNNSSTGKLCLLFAQPQLKIYNEKYYNLKYSFSIVDYENDDYIIPEENIDDILLAVIYLPKEYNGSQNNLVSFRNFIESDYLRIHENFNQFISDLLHRKEGWLKNKFYIKDQLILKDKVLYSCNKLHSAYNFSRDYKILDYWTRLSGCECSDPSVDPDVPVVNKCGWYSEILPITNPDQTIFKTTYNFVKSTEYITVNGLDQNFEEDYNIIQNSDGSVKEIKFNSSISDYSNSIIYIRYKKYCDELYDYNYYFEDISGVDGIKSDFNTSYKFEPNSIYVTVNGLDQELGTDYSIIKDSKNYGIGIKFLKGHIPTNSGNLNDWIFVKYQKIDEKILDNYFEEDLKGVNGTNKIFTTSYLFDPTDVYITINGLDQIEGSSYDYVIIKNKSDKGEYIKFNTAPQVNSGVYDIIHIKYKIL